MSYKTDVSAREEIIKVINANNNYLFISAKHASMEKHTGKICTLFEDGITDNQLLEYLTYRNYKSIVQNSYQPALEKLELLKKLSYNRLNFFNLEFNLLEDGAAAKNFVFTQNTPRDDIFKEVCEFTVMDPESARSAKARQTVEELLMNAQITAPSTKNSTERAASYLKVEYTDSLIAFSAFDDYGSLDCKKFLKKVETGLALGLNKSINFGKGGAGLGSSLIFQNSDSLFLGVNANKKTRVSSIMPYNVTERKFEGMQRSLHIIEIKS